jgi:hypothetical protein
MTELARFQLAKGVAADLPAHTVGRDHFTGGANLRCAPFPERAPGYAAVYATPQAEVRSLLNAVIGGVNYWIYHGRATSFAAAGAVHTDITRTAALTTHSDSNRWTVGLFNGLPFANNALDEPMYWDGVLANNFVNLPGWIAGDRAYTLRAWGNFLIALNLTTSGGAFPSLVKWSSAAAAGSMPSSWTPAATNEAGSSPKCADTDGALIDGAQLGNGFAIYKERHAYLMTYLERSSFIFDVTRLPIDRGVLTRNCIATFKGRHFIVTGDGDIGLTDGLTFESIADNRARALLFNSLDQANYQRTFVVPYPRRDEIWVCFPSSGADFCDRALIWNTAKNTWTPAQDLPDVACGALGIVSDTAPDESWDADSGTWDADSTIWDAAGYSSARASLLLGAPNDATPTSSLILEQDNGLTANGEAFAASVSKYGMDLGDPAAVKLVTRVYLEVDADTGVQLLVRLGAQQEPRGTTTWSAEQTYTVGGGKGYVDIFARGRFISLEARSTASAAWKLTAFVLAHSMVGAH